MVSRLPVRHKDAVYVLPITRNSHHDINQGVEATWSVRAVPFLAQYNDYGYYEKPKDTPEYREFLRIMGVTNYQEDQVRHNVDREDNVSPGLASKSQEKKFSYAFIHKELYEALSTPSSELKLTVKESWLANPLILEKLGMHKSDAPLNDGKYKATYTHESLPGLELRTDGYAIATYHKGRKLGWEDGVSYTKDFIEFINKHYHAHTLVINTPVLSYSPMWVPVHQYLTRKQILEEQKATLQRLTAEGKDVMTILSTLSLLSGYEGIGVNYKYADPYVGDTENPVLIGFLTFLTTLRALHYTITPQIYHSQEYDYNIHKHVNALVNKQIVHLSKSLKD